MVLHAPRVVWHETAKVHRLLLMKTFARVGDEVAQLIPTFPTKGSAPRLTLQVPDRFKTSAALLRAEPWRSSGEYCVSNLPENQGSCLKQGLCRSLFNLLLRCSSYFNAQRHLVLMKLCKKSSSLKGQPRIFFLICKAEIKKDCLQPENEFP